MSLLSFSPPFSIARVLSLPSSARVSSLTCGSLCTGPIFSGGSECCSCETAYRSSAGSLYRYSGSGVSTRSRACPTCVTGTSTSSVFTLVLGSRLLSANGLTGSASLIIRLSGPPSATSIARYNGSTPAGMLSVLPADERISRVLIGRP